MKIQKPIFSKLWAIALTGVLALALAACSGESTPAPTEAPTMATTAASTEVPTETTVPDTLSPETEPKKEFYQVGDTLTCENFEITYLASGDYTHAYLTPAEGNRFIFLKFRATNTTPSFQGIPDGFFQCYADGNLVEKKEICYWGDLPSRISGGRTMSGSIFFEVPKEAQKIEVEFDDAYYRRKYTGEPKPTFIPKFLYEGEQNSGLSEAGNPNSTPGAMQVGDTAKFSNFKVTYLSCYLEKGNFFPTKEDHHLIACEFEYENLSSDALLIDYYCFADGLTCEMLTVQGEEEFSWPLPSGQKSTYVIRFEIPDGASVVEYEQIITLLDEANARGSVDRTLVFNASSPTE